MLLRYLPILAFIAILAPSSVPVFSEHISSILAPLHEASGRSQPFSSASSSFLTKNDDLSLQASAQRYFGIAVRSEQLSKGSWGKNLLQELNLNQDQQQQIEQIRRRYQQAMFQRQTNLDSAQQKLMNMIVGTDATEVIRFQQQQVVQLRQELGELRFECMLAIREILTPEQRQKLAQIMQSHRKNLDN